MIVKQGIFVYMYENYHTFILPMCSTLNVFKPHRTINNDLNISHNQQSTTRAWMHARMLPNYLCYESVGLVCFVGFFYPSIGSYRSLLQSFEIFVIPLLYIIKLCTSGFAVNRKIRETCWYILRKHWIAPGFDLCKDYFFRKQKKVRDQLGCFAENFNV